MTWQKTTITTHYYSEEGHLFSLPLNLISMHVVLCVIAPMTGEENYSVASLNRHNFLTISLQMRKQLGLY